MLKLRECQPWLAATPSPQPRLGAWWLTPTQAGWALGAASSRDAILENAA